MTLSTTKYEWPSSLSSQELIDEPIIFLTKSHLSNFPQYLQPGARGYRVVGRDFPSYLQDGGLVVSPDMYFMVGDHRHNSVDSRYWGFVPRANILAVF